MTTQKVLITGNTYPVRDKLKALGARWDGDAKGWAISADQEAQARALVEGQAPGTPGKCSKCGGECKAPYTLCWGCKPKSSRCRECGAVQNARGFPRIYRNGVCSDCYQSEREEREMGY